MNPFLFCTNIGHRLLHQLSCTGRAGKRSV